MRRLVPLLLVSLLLSSLLAGCFGGDEEADGHDDHEHDEDPMEDGHGDENNTTEEDPFENANVAPQPKILIKASIDGAEATTGDRFLVTRSANLTLTLDGSGSTDEDGEITAYAWELLGPGSFSKTAATAVSQIDLPSFTDHGVYFVQLKVLDDRNALNLARMAFSLDLAQDVNYDLPMRGAGTFDRGTGDQKASTVPAGPQEVPVGTFNVHQVTLREHLETLDLTLHYAAGTGGGQLGLYAFAGDLNDDETGTDEPAATAQPGASPVTLSVPAASLTTSSKNTIRVELAGQDVTNYTLKMRATYTFTGDVDSIWGPVPSDGGADDNSTATNNSTDDGADGSSVPQRLPAPPLGQPQARDALARAH